MIDVYWGSGSPYSWRVLLALEHKRLEYRSHVLQFSLQEHKAPHIVAMNPRGRLPILKHDDYVCFESVAVLYYLDLKYPEPPIFGRTPEEAGVIMRVICEFEAYAEDALMKIVHALFEGGVNESNVGELTRAIGGLTDTLGDGQAEAARAARDQLDALLDMVREARLTAVRRSLVLETLLAVILLGLVAVMGTLAPPAAMMM